LTGNNVFMAFPKPTILLQRLSALKKGDALSEAFDKLSAQQKYDLLEALRVPKPPG
jgi:CMP-N-acetylneuraminic acid synthetase